MMMWLCNRSADGHIPLNHHCKHEILPSANKKWWNILNYAMIVDFSHEIFEYNVMTWWHIMKSVPFTYSNHHFSYFRGRLDARHLCSRWRSLHPVAPALRAWHVRGWPWGGGVLRAANGGWACVWVDLVSGVMMRTGTYWIYDMIVHDMVPHTRNWCINFYIRISNRLISK